VDCRFQSCTQHDCKRVGRLLIAVSLFRELEVDVDGDGHLTRRERDCLVECRDKPCRYRIAFRCDSRDVELLKFLKQSESGGWRIGKGQFGFQTGLVGSVSNEFDEELNRLRSVRVAVPFGFFGGEFHPFRPAADGPVIRACNRDDRSRRRDTKRSVVVALNNLVERNFAGQVTDGRIFFVIADSDIQYAGKPRLGFFDRERSGHVSDHAFDLQHGFRVLIRQLRRVIHLRERAEDTGRKDEEPDEST